MAKPMAGRRLAAHLRDQAVIAAAGADGVLAAERIGDPLEHRARVVVEAAHQPRIHRVGNAQRIEAGAQLREVLLRLGIEVIGEHRRVADDRLRRRMFAVEDAQRVALEAALAVFIQRVEVLAKIVLQQFAIGLARLGRAQRIDLQLHAREA